MSRPRNAALPPDGFTDYGSYGDTPGSLIYTPATGYLSQDSFTYRVSDGIAYSNTATLTITMTSYEADVITLPHGRLGASRTVCRRL